MLHYFDLREMDEAEARKPYHIRRKLDVTVRYLKFELNKT